MISTDFDTLSKTPRQSKCHVGYLLRRLEIFFFRYGQAVASRPVVCIVACLVLATAAATGLVRYRAENEANKLFIPEDSSSRRNADWLWENFPPSLRLSSVIFEADNVLSPGVIKRMFNLHRKIDSIVTKYEDSWSNMCQKFPVVKVPNIADIIGKRRRKRDNSSWTTAMDDFFEDFDEDQGNERNDESADFGEAFSAQYYPNPYCRIAEKMSKVCLETGILEMFARGGEYDERVFDRLTSEEILQKLNRVNTSGVFNVPRNYTTFLSGIKRDGDSGSIVSARATVMFWFGKMNTTAAQLSPDKKRSEPVDQRTLEFEAQMISAMRNSSDPSVGLESFVSTRRSFGDIAGATILGDVRQLASGYLLLYAYVMLTLGTCSCIGHRVLLSTAGIASVVLGLLVSYGLCSACGLFFAPLHNVLPFLLLGIGIDDMFVIMQCWNCLTSKEQKLPYPARFGKTMEHAGVAITVTSLTDVVAFGVGGITVLPALRSFCIFAAVGILATYFFQCTFFLAWMVIDQRRIESRRNGCCPCFAHKEAASEGACSQHKLMKVAFEGFGSFLVKPTVKVIVILVTTAVAVLAVWGNLRLRQEFDPAWFLPSDSYLAQWIAKSREYFPAGGERVTIYLHEVDYVDDFAVLTQLAQKLEAQTDIVDNVDAWPLDFGRYAEKYIKESPRAWNRSHFEARLSQFLFSPKGGRFRERFTFAQPPRCGHPAPHLRLSDIIFVHKIIRDRDNQIAAMNRIKSIIENANFSTGKVFPLSEGYVFWETNEVIAYELYRNLLLAIVCVFFTTLVLLSNVVTSLLVLFSVLLSLVDVAGFMHFWGLTIDTVSCVNLIISIGICVDYSVHIAHTFMIETGSRDDRIRRTLTDIGPAVLNGGISTFLAFVLLAGSKSHVFSSFFKIFFLVVTFGLYHGLVFTPVLLSIIGPQTHKLEEVQSTPKESRAEEQEVAHETSV